LGVARASSRRVSGKLRPRRIPGDRDRVAPSGEAVEGGGLFRGVDRGQKRLEEGMVPVGQSRGEVVQHPWGS
jgi:hypothetical protein